MDNANLTLRSIYQKEHRLDGSNFSDWYRDLRIVLKSEPKLRTIEQALFEKSDDDISRGQRDVCFKHLDDTDMERLKFIMLVSMTPELLKQYENMDPFTMIKYLKSNERYEVSKQLFRCKMDEGAEVGPHVLKMIGYIEKLETFGTSLDNDLAIDLVLQSLPDSYSQFIFNMGMNKKTLPELLTVLQTVEQDIKRSIPMFQVDADNGNTLKSVGGINKERKVVCFYCGKPGHWKKRCKAFLAYKKKNVVSTSEGM